MPTCVIRWVDENGKPTQIRHAGRRRDDVCSYAVALYPHALYPCSNQWPSYRNQPSSRSQGLQTPQTLAISNNLPSYIEALTA